MIVRVALSKQEGPCRTGRFGRYDPSDIRKSSESLSWLSKICNVSLVCLRVENVPRVWCKFKWSQFIEIYIVNWKTNQIKSNSLYQYKMIMFVRYVSVCH